MFTKLYYHTFRLVSLMKMGFQIYKDVREVDLAVTYKFLFSYLKCILRHMTIKQFLLCQTQSTLLCFSIYFLLFLFYNLHSFWVQLLGMQVQFLHLQGTNKTCHSFISEYEFWVNKNTNSNSLTPYCVQNFWFSWIIWNLSPWTVSVTEKKKNASHKKKSELN